MLAFLIAVVVFVCSANDEAKASSSCPTGEQHQKVALVTGITGQDGSYLAEFLLEKGYKVVGLVRRTSLSSQYYQRIAHIQHRLTLAPGDLLDQSSLNRVIAQYAPDEVYNLAALSFVHTSFSQPEITGDVTGLGVLRLLEAIHMYGKKSLRFYQASSSEMFGLVQQIPQTEDTPFYPRSPYGVSKLYGHWITKNYRESYDMFAVSGILFNHESPRRGVEFVTRKITNAVARIKHGLQEKLSLGNLEARRDWGFTGDFVQAMWLMLQRDTPSDFVIATNETHTVREFCQLAFARVGLNYEDYVVVDPQFYRPAEVELLIGDYSLAKSELNWAPAVDFPSLVNLMVDHDMVLVEREMKYFKEM